ncbi:MAG TPA: V-type ATP synthase subunit D [Streptosporangiaceae bacterium]
MTGPRLSVPPGRAGRLWLDRRLAAARRGADLLDRKLRILQAELAGRRTAAERTGQRWAELSAEADRTLLIASLLGGQRAIRLAAGPGEAQVRIGYQVTIGVRHPAAGSCSPPAGQAPWSGQPAGQARQAHLAALDAAVGHAVAAQAVRVLEAEATATRYRLRAIRDRLIPALEEARAQAALAIDELERADAARLRRAGPGGPGGTGPSSLPRAGPR